ncbi:hypothetical protein M2390_001977 [Mycetocola sp. BIGb0189]|uniref:glycosyltransferase family protein n=1 Tax=Mycetocola sp. BIGb0189 TaxID=2940604 RepID=UPI002166D3D1|nr:glycosyltransferase [Mycetocola sp. BIGb0189]MCS4276783.1 hypothetical protein [Mycetocola sp. BIGb0189]
MSITLPFDANDVVGAEYRRLLAGTIAADKPENVVFAVSNTDPASGRGDLYVALGLASALDRLGWGVRFLDQTRWGEVLPPETTVSIAMLESYVPALMGPDVTRLAWARNWTDSWATLHYLQAFDGVLASSSAALTRITENFAGPAAVLPIAADCRLFRPRADRERTVDLSTTVNEWGQNRDIQRAVAALPEDITLHWFGARQNTANEYGSSVHRHAPISFFELPDLYSQSRFVLDDLTPSAREYGSQNSRLYESLAAGALPILNEGRGLDELGLDEVPVYSSPEELTELLTRLNADPEGSAALAARLHEVVIERHDYTARAVALVDFLARVRADSSANRVETGPLADLADERARRLVAEYHQQRLTGEAAHATERLALVQAENDGLRAEVQNAHAELTRIATLPAVRVVRRVKRLFRGRA